MILNYLFVHFMTLIQVEVTLIELVISLEWHACEADIKLHSMWH